MKKSKFTESQITSAIRAYVAGKDVHQICRELAINMVTFYNLSVLRIFSGRGA